MRKTDDEIELKEICELNYLMLNSEFICVGSTCSIPVVMHGMVFYDKLKPIHLTNDWLLAFGFETVDNFKYTHADSGTILYNKGGWHYDYGKGESKIMLFHVHQLQNLFTLKNEDLVLVRPELIRK